MAARRGRKKRVIAYIDGYNLYHGIKSTHGRKWLWLDVEKMCESFLLPDQRLKEVKYFSASVRDDPAAGARQQAYWAALRAQTKRTDMTLGRHQEKTMKCFGCGNKWRTYEEKESDVRLALALAEDAAKNRFDTAILISGDSDLVPAVQAAMRLHPGPAKIIAAFPPNRVSVDLRNACTADFVIGPAKLRAAQLPNQITTRENGKRRIIQRPPKWS
jgi:uncharacterized LabA/DUF88 family protein